MHRFLKSLFVALPFTAVTSAAQESKQRLVTMDEDVCITFYDLPSRRFHDIRNAFVNLQFPAVARDMSVTAG